MTKNINDLAWSDPGLEGVYRRALYRVDAREPFVLRVGVYSEALERLYESTNHRSAAFLTAANPGGVKVSDELNIRAEARLRRQLIALSLPVTPGIGLDADMTSDWPGERSLLVLGIQRENVIRLGLEHGQLATIWCPETAIPELLMLKRTTPP